MWFPRQGAEPAQRSTYCSITAPNPKIQRFSESFSIRPGQSRNFSTSTAELTESTSPIKYLDVIGDQGSGLPRCKVLAVHSDGEVRCFSLDLKVQEWKATTSAQVEFAFTVNIEQAQQTFLKNREDVLAMLGSDADASETQFLILVTRSADNSDNPSTLRIAQISTSGASCNPLRELASLTLPQPPGLNVRNLNYSWLERSGLLLQNNLNELAIYDLTRASPRLMYHVEFGKEKIASCLFLSPCSVAINTKTSISIIDVQYCSLQGKYNFDQNLGRKHPHGANTRLLSYFAASGLIIALRAREILVVQLSTGEGNKSRKRKRDGVLINSIGRGPFLNDKALKFELQSTPKALGAYLDLSESSKDWNKRKATLDDLFKDGNSEEFERTIGMEIGMTATEQEIEGKFLPDPRKLRYVLNKIFSVDDSSPASLNISWLPKALSRWLIRQGLFSIDQIETSLKIHDALPRTSRLSTGAFVHAVAKWDPSLELLLFILKSSVSLDTSEIVHALRQLIILDVPKDMKLLTNGEAGDANGDISMDSVPSPTTFGENSIAHALFESIMVRLNSHPTSKVSRALKSELSTSELRSLVDLARTELVKGRWLSPHMEDDVKSGAEDPPSSDQLHSITRLFNCAIDSIGTGGWIIGASTTDEFTETADTIAYMKAEISAALEGIEEATYLKGMLEKVLLHGKIATLSNTHNFSGAGGKSVAPPANPSSVLVGEDGLSMNPLPLGLDPALGMSTKRVGAGGQLIERSHRDINGIRNRMVGKYSFERILV